MAALTRLVSQLRDANEHLVLAAMRAQVLHEEAEARNRQQNEFLAMLAHELRNPLAPISAAAQLLRMPGVDQRRVQQSSEVISRQVRHMTELVDDLLDVSRVTRGLVSLVRNTVDINMVVASAVEQARPALEARKHALLMHLGGKAAFVHGDQTRLVQVLVNLLTNAAKYTPQGGQIVIEVEVQATDVRLCVSDNGSGIEPALLPHVFDLFTQGERTPDRAQGGLGLGLALVRSMVALHGGRTEAHSAGPGRGSAFAVFLPLLDDPVAVPEADRAPRASEATVPMQLLIVDDNLDAADSLAALLMMEGHQVTVCEDGFSALDHALANPVHAFILDIGLPGMDGYELVRRLKQLPQTRGAVFIALTGYGQAHDKVLAKAAGFDNHFVKPVAWHELVGALAQVRVLH